MRPEDVIVPPRTAGPSITVPIDIELEALDAELEAAGARARAMLNGRRQPTRFFSLRLRQALLDALGEPAAAAGRLAD